VVWYKGFLYQAANWKTARRVVAKVEFHFGELFPRVGFIVTNLETPSRAVVRFYNKRGTAEQWIKEGKQAVKMTRLSCHSVSLQPSTAGAEPAKEDNDALESQKGYMMSGCWGPKRKFRLKPLGIQPDLLMDEGAVGDIAYNIFDANGKGHHDWSFFLTVGDHSAHHGVEFYRNLVRQKRPVIVMAGTRKESVLRHALEAKPLNVLITDAVTAQRLLSM
jgi:hypothetical protein